MSYIVRSGEQPDDVAADLSNVRNGLNLKCNLITLAPHSLIGSAKTEEQIMTGHDCAADSTKSW